MSIDLQTIFIMQLLLWSLMAFFLAQIRQNAGDDARAVGYWLYLYIAIFVGQIGIALRGIAPLWLTMVPANTLVASAVVSNTYALGAFLGVKVSRWYGIGVLSLYALVYFLFGHVWDVAAFRVIAFNVVVISHSIVSAAFAFRNRERATRPASRMIGWLMVLFIAVAAIRVVGLFDPENGGFKPGAGPWNTPNMFAMAMLYFALGFSAVQMMDARLRHRIARGAEEKTLLIREMHHRTKNDFALVESLISIEKSALEDEGARAVLDRIRARVRSFALLHSRLYRGNVTGRVDAGEYLSLVASGLLSGESAGILLETEIDSLELDAGSAINLGLIANELITNSLKHAFLAGSRGTIRLSLGTEDGSIRLQVEDDGIGLPAAESGEEGERLGMTLISALLEQKAGKMERSAGRDGRGARFTVKIPFGEGERR